MPRPRARALCVAAVLAAALAGGGCEQRRFDAALARDTQDAWLGFLARHGGGRNAAEARVRVETLRWQEARGASSVYAVRRYLADYPEGRFAADARRRLAELRLARARASGAVAALRRFLETNPGDDFAREARADLRRVELRAALRRGDLASLRAFVDEFPLGPGVDEARLALRRRELQAAGDDVRALELVAMRNPGTPEGDEATRRLGALEARRVRNAGVGALPALERFRLRHPHHPERAALEAHVAGVELQCATVWLDAAALERWLGSHSSRPEAAAARARLKAIRRGRPGLGPRVRELLDAALPYRPAAGLDDLRARALGGELEAARTAVADLAHAPEPEAAALLVDLATGPQLVVAAQAVDTLLELCGRRGAGGCADLLAGAWAGRPGEPEGLRPALLRLAVGDERAALRALVDAIVAGERQGRARVLPTVLVARLRTRFAPDDEASLDAVARAIADVRAHLGALERLFPVEIDRERAPEALLAARTAATLARLLASIHAPLVAPLRGALETRVREWEARLAATVPGFAPSPADPLAATVQAYEKRRAVAAEALAAFARTEPLARPAAEGAKARNAGLRLCPGATRAAGVGPGSRATP